MNSFNKHLSLLTVLLLFVADPGLAQDLQSFYTAAKEARENKEFEKFYSNINEASKLHPYHQVILYNKGIACALTGRTREAIETLQSAILIDSRFDLGIEELRSLAGTKEFDELLALKNNLDKIILTSDTAFIISDKAIHIESVTYDPASQAFYLGSINQRKIIKRNKKGITTDFSGSEHNVMSAVFGVRVDKKRGLLWACSSPMLEMENYDSTIRSAVHKYKLKSGKLLKSYPIGTSSIFGDLTLDANGSVYVSDSKNNKVLRLNEATGSLEIFFESEEFWNLQGITLSNDNKSLFISDYIKGPYRLDLSTKTLYKLDAPFGQSLKGIDGLLYYKNSLVALQNGVFPFRVVQYHLDERGEKIVSANTIGWAHPALGEPTCGHIEGDTLYYIANSQWGAYGEDHQFQIGESKPTLILKNKLK